MARSLVTLETLERYLRLSSLSLVAVLTLRMLELTLSVPNNLDPDQARHIVGPDLGPNCLQRLSTEAI